MSKQTIQIADKPTLDEVKELLTNGSSGLECKPKFTLDGAILSNALYFSGPPESFSQCNAVVYHDEIHILGSTDRAKLHYTVTLSELGIPIYMKQDDLPFNMSVGSNMTVVYKDRIHVLGATVDGATTNYTKHYAFDGTTWVSLTPAPYGCLGGTAVVYNDRIHLMGGDDGSSSNNGSSKHYTWDDNTWVNRSGLPGYFKNIVSVVYHDEIHIFGASYNSYSNKYYTIHAKLNGTGSNWELVQHNDGYNERNNYLPTKFFSLGGSTYARFDSTLGSAVVYSNCIHIFGSTNEDSTHSEQHLKFDGYSFRRLDILPRSPVYGTGVVYKDRIFIFGRFYCMVGDTAHSVEIYLREGNRILCDTSTLIPISENLETVEGGYRCSKTGLCRLYTTVNDYDNFEYTII